MNHACASIWFVNTHTHTEFISPATAGTYFNSFTKLHINTVWIESKPTNELHASFSFRLARMIRTNEKPCGNEMKRNRSINQNEHLVHFKGKKNKNAHFDNTSIGTLNCWCDFSKMRYSIFVRRWFWCGGYCIYAVLCIILCTCFQFRFSAFHAQIAYSIVFEVYRYTLANRTHCVVFIIMQIHSSTVFTHLTAV